MTLLILRSLIDLLCAAGLYASVFMYRKSILAEAGKVKGKSVVKSPAAKLFFGVSNSLWGIIFYVAVSIVMWFASGLIMWTLIFAALGGAALTSAYLAYRLIFISKIVCPYCWTSHTVNWSLVVLAAILYHLKSSVHV